MPTEKELLGIINQQRKYYRDGILRIVELLTQDGLGDYARATLAIAENYGIVNKDEALVSGQKIEIKEDESVRKLIINELKHGELSGSMLREKTRKIERHRYYRILSQLIDSEAVVRVGKTNRLIYKIGRLI